MPCPHNPGMSTSALASTPLQSRWRYTINLKPYESAHAQALERRNINIKRFDEIPMADAEMVFPDKKIYLKPLLIIQLLIAIIGGIVATFAALLSARPEPLTLLCVVVVEAHGYPHIAFPETQTLLEIQHPNSGLS